MGRKINIEGNTFGLLTAMNREFKDKYSRWHWMCKCQCGNEKIISQNNLRSGNSYSCGCEKHIKRVIVDLTGKKFNRLTVIDRDFIKNKTFWNCVCDCGNICSVFHGHLQNGHTRSCGAIVQQGHIKMTFADYSFNSIIYSNHSTSATCYEKQEIRQYVTNEWCRAAFVKAHFEDSQTIVQVYTEPLSDYLSPDPIRSYNVKLRIHSTSKGLPHAYNEPFEEIL